MKTKLATLAGAIALAFSGASFALPSLQLDIEPGVYVGGGEESTIATDDQFTLRAFGSAEGKVTTTQLLSQTYYVSMALVGPSGPVGPTAGNYGSFIFNGNTIDVTADMIYGSPPLEILDPGHDAGDLAPHGIFPTFFTEIAFGFTGTNTTGKYNVADGSSAPGTMFYKDFAVDVANLAAGYAIHFDLYNQQVKDVTSCTKVKRVTTCTVTGHDIDIGDDFAPFSHDAQSGSTRDPKDPPNEVPEPASLTLLGLGALAAVRRARKS